ncbi:MAG: hypothetical protein JW955_11110 [Sedimentisphaerales bacterium]|nr:hypothetical protein [Sedimentisphaerales bacterium]
MRRAIPWLLAGVLWVTGCKDREPVAPDAGKQYTIATVVKLDGIAWFDRMKEGVQRVARETGHRCLQLGPYQADAALLVQIIEAFDNAAYGAHLMDPLARCMGRQGEYAVFVGRLTSKSHNDWIDAAIARQKRDYPRWSW